MPTDSGGLWGQRGGVAIAGGVVAALALLLCFAVRPAVAQEAAPYNGCARVGDAATVTGVIEEPEVTAYTYGSHVLTDETSGTPYALHGRSVELGAYKGKRVTLTGAIVPGYDVGQVEDGPTLLDVSEIRELPADAAPVGCDVLPPRLWVKQAGITVDEGKPASIHGTYNDDFDRDIGDAQVRFTSSEGVTSHSPRRGYYADSSSRGTWSWSLPNVGPALCPGQYSIEEPFYVAATDATGRTERTWFVVDVRPLPPVVRLTEPGEGSTTRGEAQLSADATDPAGIERVEFLVDGTVVGTDHEAPYGATWDTTGRGDGAAEVSARAVDSCGDETVTSVRRVVVDNGAPSAPPDTRILSGPEGSTNDNMPIFFFGGSDDETAGADLLYSFKFDDEPWSPYSARTNSPEVWLDEAALRDGPHSFWVRAKDGAGNEDPSPAEGDFTVDTAAPEPPVIAAPAESTRINATAFALTGAAEPGSNVELFEGSAPRGEATVDGSGRWSVALSGVAEGDHSYAARATDPAGNVSAASGTRTVTVDTLRAAVTGVSPSKGFKTSPASTNVVVAFSEGMNPTTLNGSTFKLIKRGTTTPIPAVVRYDAAAKRAILDPTSGNLVPGAAYVAAVTTGAKDLAGNPLAAAEVWGFTVNGAPSILSPGPRPNASTADRTPTISATVRDAQTDLARSNVRLYVDGVAKTSFAYDAATDRLRYTSSLKTGTHKVTVIAVDPQGMKATRTWSFVVR